jgi:hypothetical protein
MSDREINDLVAERVAGLQRLVGPEKVYASDPRQEWKIPTIDGKDWFAGYCPNYVCAWNETFGLLNKWPHSFEVGKYMPGVSTPEEAYYCTLPVTGYRDGQFHKGRGRTLLRAACMALLIAHRVQIKP